MVATVGTVLYHSATGTAWLVVGITSIHAHERGASDEKHSRARPWLICQQVGTRAVPLMVNDATWLRDAGITEAPTDVARAYRRAVAAA